MIVNVLKDFTFSRNGIHAEQAVKGTSVDIPDALFLGLMVEKYITVPDVTPTPVAVEVVPTATPVETAFDPDTATIEELQAFLRSKGVPFHHKAGVARLRELAAQ